MANYAELQLLTQRTAERRTEEKLFKDIERSRKLTSLLTNEIANGPLKIQWHTVPTLGQSSILMSAPLMARGKYVPPTLIYEISKSPEIEWKRIVSTQKPITLDAKQLGYLEKAEFKLGVSKVISGTTIAVAATLVLSPFIVPYILPFVSQGIASAFTTIASVVGNGYIPVDTLLMFTWTSQAAINDYEQGMSVSDVLIKHITSAVVVGYITPVAASTLLATLPSGPFNLLSSSRIHGFLAKMVMQPALIASNKIVAKITDFSHLGNDLQTQVVYNWSYREIMKRQSLSRSLDNPDPNKLNSVDKTYMAYQLRNSGWSLPKLLKTQNSTVLKKQASISVFQMGMASSFAHVINQNATRVWASYIQNLDGSSPTLASSGNMLDAAADALGVVISQIIKPVLRQWLLAEVALIPQRYGTYIHQLKQKLRVSMALWPWKNNEPQLLAPTTYQIIKDQIQFGVCYSAAEDIIFGTGPMIYSVPQNISWNTIYDKVASLNIHQMQAVFLKIIDSFSEALSKDDRSMLYPAHIAEHALTTFETQPSVSPDQQEYIQRDIPYLEDPKMISMCLENPTDYTTVLETFQQEVDKVNSYKNQVTEVEKIITDMKNRIDIREINFTKMQDLWSRGRMVDVIDMIETETDEKLIERWDLLTSKLRQDEPSIQTDVLSFISEIEKNIESLPIGPAIKMKQLEVLRSGDVQEAARQVNKMQAEIERQAWQNSLNTQPISGITSMDIAARWTDIQVRVGNLISDYKNDLEGTKQIYEQFKLKRDQMSIETRLMERSLLVSLSKWMDAVREAGIEHIPGKNVFDITFAYSPANIESVEVALDNIRNNIANHSLPVLSPIPGSKVTGTPEEILKTHSDILVEEVRFLESERQAIKSGTAGGSDDIFGGPTYSESTTIYPPEQNNTAVDEFFASTINGTIFKRALMCSRDIGADIDNQITSSYLMVPTVTQNVFSDIKLELPAIGNGATLANFQTSMTNLTQSIDVNKARQVPQIEAWGNVLKESPKATIESQIQTIENHVLQDAKPQTFLQRTYEFASGAFSGFADLLSEIARSTIGFSAIFERQTETELINKLDRNYDKIKTWLSFQNRFSADDITKFNSVLKELAIRLPSNPVYSYNIFRKILSNNQTNAVTAMFELYDNDVKRIEESFKGYDGKDIVDSIRLESPSVSRQSFASALGAYTDRIKHKNVFINVKETAVWELKYLVGLNKLTVDDSLYQLSTNIAQSLDLVINGLGSLSEMEKYQVYTRFVLTFKYDTKTGDPILSLIMMMASIRCSDPNASASQCSSIGMNNGVDMNSLIWEAFSNGDIPHSGADGTPKTFISAANAVLKNATPDFMLDSETMTALNPATVANIVLGTKGSNIRYYHDRYTDRVASLDQDRLISKLLSTQTNDYLYDVFRSINSNRWFASITRDPIAVTNITNFQRNLVDSITTLGLVRTQKDQVVPAVGALDPKKLMRIAGGNSSSVKFAYDRVKSRYLSQNQQIILDGAATRLQLEGINMASNFVKDGMYFFWNLGKLYQSQNAFARSISVPQSTVGQKSLGNTPTHMGILPNGVSLLAGTALQTGYRTFKIIDTGIYTVVDVATGGYYDASVKAVNNWIRMAPIIGQYFEDFDDVVATLPY